MAIVFIGLYDSADEERKKFAIIAVLFCIVAVIIIVVTLPLILL